MSIKNCVNEVLKTLNDHERIDLADAVMRSKAIRSQVEADMFVVGLPENIQKAFLQVQSLVALQRFENEVAEMKQKRLDKGLKANRTLRLDSLRILSELIAARGQTATGSQLVKEAVNMAKQLHELIIGDEDEAEDDSAKL